MNDTKYCDLQAFAKGYQEIHGPLSFFVCVFGSVANILNICVLTTKEMRWPTNFILTGLAVADLLVMLEYLPFCLHRYINLEQRNFIQHYSYNWAVFMMFHALFSQMFHFISCCLTVILAVWRYLAITSPHNSSYWCDTKKTVAVIVFTYLGCTLICFPLFVALEIKPHNQSCDIQDKIIDNDTMLLNSSNILHKTIYVTTYVSDTYSVWSFWIYAVVIKLVPCTLLTHLSRKLVMVLLETKKRKNMLLNQGVPLRNLNESKPMRKKDRQADRTTGMLVAVLLLFLLTEFPQAILGLLGATKGSQFQKQCYDPLGDIMDILALTNSAINFILYCTMSRQFRTTFQEVFKLNCLLRFNPLSQYTNASEKATEKTQISAV
ncbi:G-protein coupled receptor dmsr-1 isoform X2 [Leptinotarsa decemlineata]|uniref:G-protein coupled receptor dmsr-1 isoform X2 n=1 Tax=Leptinotarsa decemlineata TaxID=7539 RepID=UPI003D3061FF